MLKGCRGGRLATELKNLVKSPVTRRMLASSVGRLFAVSVLPGGLVTLLHRSDLEETRYMAGDLWRDYHHRAHAIQETASTSLNQMLYNYMTKQNLKMLLRYEDRNAMRFSVEARTPFADDIHLIEYLFSVPSSYKIHEGWSKSLLRSATAGIVPQVIRERRDKIGFTTPERAWLLEIKDDLRDYITSDLNDFLDVRAVARDWDKLFHGSANVWRMVNLGIWKKTVIGR
jgi:asparagine synthase (glutamine-hydrolysing)